MYNDKKILLTECYTEQGTFVQFTIVYFLWLTWDLYLPVWGTSIVVSARLVWQLCCIPSNWPFIKTMYFLWSWCISRGVSWGFLIAMINLPTYICSDPHLKHIFDATASEQGVTSWLTTFPSLAMVCFE